MGRWGECSRLSRNPVSSRLLTTPCDNGVPSRQRVFKAKRWRRRGMTDEPQQLSERELAFLEKERIMNAALDEKLARNHDKFPTAVYFIIPNEFCERFCYYGIRNLLNQYLKTGYGFEEYKAKSQVHLFNGLVYMFPLVGAALSDSFLGKYKTIVYLSFVYLLGNTLLSIFSINGILGQFGNYPYYAYIIPAILIAVGTGGIKPCVASHGGDQFLPSQAPLMDKFFAIFYVSINVGALISQYLTPYLKDYVQCFGSKCYFIAYGIPTIFFAIALAVFMLGFRYYRIVPAQGEFLPWKAVKLTFLALKRRNAATAAQRNTVGHWLRFAEPEYGYDFIEETRQLGKVMVMFVPMVFCWVLYDQNGTEWQNQYEKMDKLFFGFIPMPIEASSNINSILIILLVPFMSFIVYPFLEKRGIQTPLASRMSWGFFFIILAFVVSTLLEYIVDSHAHNMVIKDHAVVSCNGCINGTWQLPQWILLSLGEALFSPTGIQFAYTQVGRQMKASSTSIWLLTTAFGNYIVMVMEILMHPIESAPIRMWIYIAISTVSLAIFVLLNKYWFVSKEEEEAIKRAQSATALSIKL
ncbi:hypothetical protein DSO57_1007465 [Entomophthora muscae]|uniref:Uncharacterized protein n=1 Tax=Entomophthora muscae TaxID=34485 RepID=A0ACC2SWJ6_9FUNG|nr:hypothetical protein DSO57_1007465 [Entomophthora muscae]